MHTRWLIVFVLLFAINTVAQDNISMDVLNPVNAARQERGIPALLFNASLQIAAQSHSDDMASVDNLSHIGTDGSQFWERMQAAGYNLSAGAENILLRGDSNPEQAFLQWFNSEPHRVNILNADYVEVGIAYAPSVSGRYYFTMVLGARDDFVAPTPPPINTPIPTNTAIPPTVTSSPTIPIAATTIPATATSQAIVTPIPIQASATPIATQNIVTNTPLPTATEFVPPDIRLVYDNNSLVLINVSGGVLNLANLIFESDSGSMAAFRWNTDFLSQPLSGFTNGDCLQVWTLDVGFLPNPDNCRFRHGWIAVADDVAFWRSTEFFSVKNGENLVGICRIADGECEVNISRPIEASTGLEPAIFGQIPHLHLEYSDSSFTLINVAGRSLDLTGLIFRSDSGSLSIDIWNNGFLSQSLSNFGDGGCLQTWTLDQANQPPPESCRIRHAWVLVDDSGDFWRQTDSFTIERNAILIGRCFTNETRCTVSLSADLGDS